jgi:hypothetical protein
MFFPEGQVRVHVYGRPVDMRKSYDGLYALTRQELGQDPLSLTFRTSRTQFGANFRGLFLRQEGGLRHAEQV